MPPRPALPRTPRRRPRCAAPGSRRPRRPRRSRGRCPAARPTPRPAPPAARPSGGRAPRAGSGGAPPAGRPSPPTPGASGGTATGSPRTPSCARSDRWRWRPRSLRAPGSRKAGPFRLPRAPRAAAPSRQSLPSPDNLGPRAAVDRSKALACALMARATAQPTLDELAIADPPGAWAAAGFRVEGDQAEVGTVRLRLEGPGRPGESRDGRSAAHPPPSWTDCPPRSPSARPPPERRTPTARSRSTTWW